MGTLISSNALADSARRVLFLKRRYGLDIRSGLNGMRISWAVSEVMLGAWAARPPASFRPFALPTFLYVATEALAESTPLPQRGESTSLLLARKQRRRGGEGGTQRNRSAESLSDRP